MGLKMKNIMRKINHKQALILFWSCVGLWSIAVINVLFFPESINENNIGYLVILSTLFIPIIILIPLIGGGFFHNKGLVNG